MCVIDVEQRARSYLGWFFNFNGTAGVWRIQVRVSTACVPACCHGILRRERRRVH